MPPRGDDLFLLRFIFTLSPVCVCVPVWVCAGPLGGQTWRLWKNCKCIFQPLLDEENEDNFIMGFDLKWMGFPPILSGGINFVGEKKETIFKYWNTSCVSMTKNNVLIN